MAQTLAISPSYLNLIERNQRPLTATLLLRLAELHDIDPRVLAAEAPGGGAEALRRQVFDGFAAFDQSRELKQHQTGESDAEEAEDGI